MAIVSPRASARSFDFVEIDWDFNNAEHRRKLAETANSLRTGKINSVGTVTLTANAATTTLNNPYIGPKSAILFMPETANAAAELATLYVTGRGKQTCTLNHANNAQTDRDFTYVVLG